MEKLTAAAVSVSNWINQKERSLENMRKWTRAAAEQGAELVLFPELNVSGYLWAPIAKEIAEPIPGPSTEAVVQMAAEFGVTIAFGLIEREGEHCYCTHALVNGAGVIGKQRKIHVPAQEQPYWEAGNEINVFDIGKAKVGITVCRDSFFDEMTRTLYFKGAEIVLMPFAYNNVPRGRYLSDSIHGMSIIKSAWTNGYYVMVCNGAEGRKANEWEPNGRSFPGWAGVFSPWGRVMEFVDREGNDESMVVQTLDPEELVNRRAHPNFLAEELRPELYRFKV
ncbi:MAG: hypothetical protein JW750_12315 [Anaerolineaceae bacterium]|nr:hypothetical protein [Anaerolineaceae bacterium]